VVVESHTFAERALKESRAGGAGFADRLVAEVSFAEGVTEILTFDKAFGRLLGCAGWGKGVKWLRGLGEEASRNRQCS
jgi:predicted nucleic-acid-binding protein